MTECIRLPQYFDVICIGLFASRYLFKELFQQSSDRSALSICHIESLGQPALIFGVHENIKYWE